MINWLSNFWYDYQLKVALEEGKQNKAKKILKQLETSSKKLSCFASLYKQQLINNNSLAYYQSEITRLTHQLAETKPENFQLQPQPEFINYTYQCFKLNEIDRHLIQSTGIDKTVFTALEIALVEFLTAELKKIPDEKRNRELTKALEDLIGLKKGVDPSYSCRLTPHVYFAKYFLDNVYCLYLAWFIIYQQGLLRKNIKILDLAAGVNTSIFSLAILSSSLNKFSTKSIEQVNYYSLEQQADLQYRGLQFWRRYIESFPTPLNTYFRFNTTDLFDYQNYYNKIPQHYFDFVVISHCFFYELELRERSNKIYQQIFQQNLNHSGRVLLIIQGKKLFNAFDFAMTENISLEQELIEKFLEELGLKLDWYKYLSCTDKRISDKKQFHNFAKNNLPAQSYMRNISKTYLDKHYLSHYAVDDYVILAQPIKKLNS